MLTLKDNSPIEPIDRKPKVYIIHKGSHDFSQASSHGDIVVLFSDKVNVFATDQLVLTIEEKLSKSSPDDFMVLSGSMLPSAIAYHSFMQKHGVVNILMYSFKNNDYEIRTIRKSQFSAVQEEA